MPLTLTIRNQAQPGNGSPPKLVLDRRGAVIGRDPASDWWLPDPSLHISSRHCKITFANNEYVLDDTSTNGTFLNGSPARIPHPHSLRAGDVLTIGHYEIGVALDEETAAANQAPIVTPEAPAWGGWTTSSADFAPAADPSGWGAPPPASAISGVGPMAQNWAPPQVAAPPTAAAPSSTWGAPPPALPDASGWSSAIPATPPVPAARDIWGALAESNVVDWARGGFGTDSGAQVPPAVAIGAPQHAPAPPPTQGDLTQPPIAQGSGPAPAGARGADGVGLNELAAAMGLNPADIRLQEAEAVGHAGQILRRVIAGLVVMLEARARAKSQLGAQGTSLQFDGNNPLKFARTPEQALLQLLNAPERGFMTTDQAIEDSFRDLQAHQLATLKAMQGALRATLDRFSPTAIRSRATKAGVISKILPGSRDAALWKTYEREFGGVAQGSDEAFMDVFAKEFRKAYEEISLRR